MIVGLIHPGSGVGNQLHRYVATRVLAQDKGYHFTMAGSEFLKVKDFMNLDLGMSGALACGIEQPAGKLVIKSDMSLWEEKTQYYNPEINFIEDNTIIDGEFQDERYFQHRIKDIDKWLKVEKINIPDDTCVIGFRGGEFYMFPELGLPREYFEKGIDHMMRKGITKFEVHTDDPNLAKQFFPNFKIIHNVGINWRSMRYAKHAIVANSSFYILPRLLSKGETIAPRYWARRNIGQWSMPQNYYKCFTYL